MEWKEEQRLKEEMEKDKLEAEKVLMLIRDAEEELFMSEKSSR